MRDFTTSPMLTMPISFFPSSTGTWRTRFSVISTLILSTVSDFVQVATVVDIILATGRDSTLAPYVCSWRTTSRSDTIPTTPSAPTYHGADVLLSEASEQLPDRGVGVDRHHRRPLVPQDVRDAHQGLPPVVSWFTPGYGELGRRESRYRNMRHLAPEPAGARRSVAA